MYRWVILVCAAAAALAAYATEYELKWDNGKWQLSIASQKGKDVWCGNDFDVSTLKADSRIKTMRVFCRRDWPNNKWDGFRIAYFGFKGGVPASIIWPESAVPKWVKPTGPGSTLWADFGVNWVLPQGRFKFLAAVEQFYNYPNCDVPCFDTEMYNKGHTWRNYPAWEVYPFHNFMVRVVVEEASAAAPASLGRVKALYR